MKKTFVFKFGGASVKDVASIKNLTEILHNRLRNHTVIVVSAMGKTTNALEEILRKKINLEDYSSNSASLKSFHLEICKGLFSPDHRIFSVLHNSFAKLESYLQKPINEAAYDGVYDEVISLGELISSRIVHEYLCSVGLLCIWQDARELIKTDSSFRFAKVNWIKTETVVGEILRPTLEKFPVITQGFLGSDLNGSTTTLGREGSDFTAAILGSCLQSESVTIWKDVDGVLNADPKRFSDTVKFDELDYREAAELTYYGASVIHPKTIRPLAMKSIPLFVKSFLNPALEGTKIYHSTIINTVPCIVVKDDQVLVSFRVTDFTFINESHLHKIYGTLEELKLKVNLLQTSAISISLIIDNQLYKIQKLIKLLKDVFDIRYNENLQLITVKNHNDELVKKLMKDREIFVEQITRHTFQMVCKPLVS